MKIKLTAFSILILAGISSSLVANPPKDCPPPGDHMHGGHRPFVYMDTNKDDKISQEEWLAHFKEMDMNHDGFITTQEKDQHHQMMMEKRHEEMHRQMHDKMKK